jgi:hypothetical protein
VTYNGKIFTAEDAENAENAEKGKSKGLGRSQASIQKVV